MQSLIHNFKKWSVFEGFGTGEESFTQQLDIYGKERNLDISSPPGWEIEDGSGKIKFTAEIDVRNGGIDSIDFSIDEIAIELENRVYDGPDDEDGRIETLEFVFKRGDFGEDPKIEIHSFPLYINEVSLDFRNAENLDGEIDPKKVKIEMSIGNIKD
jgi:hypothetical protein